MMSESWSSLTKPDISKNEPVSLLRQHIQEHLPILGVRRELKQISSWLRSLVYYKPWLRNRCWDEIVLRRVIESQSK